MRITYLVMWGDDIGGLPRAVFAEARALAHRHDVSIVSVLRTSAQSPYDADDRFSLRYLVDATQSPPVPFRSVGIDPGRLAQFAYAKSRLVIGEQGRPFSRLTDIELEYMLRTLEADVLVTTHPPLLELASMFVPASVALVHQEHRSTETRIQALPALLHSAPRADAITVQTEQTRRWLLDSLGEAAPRVEIVRPSLSVQVRPRSSLDSRTVVVAARLVEEKRISDLIQAFERLSAKHRTWRMRIFGEGPLSRALQRRIGDLGLANQVQLMGATPVMAREWAKAAIGALSSRTEGFGLAILEAFAAGVPFVSYDSPNGPGEIIGHESDGFLVPVGSIEGLIQALDRLMSDDRLRRAMGRRALDKAKRLGEHDNFATVEGLYTELHGLSPNESLARSMVRKALSPWNDLSLGKGPRDSEGMSFASAGGGTHASVVSDDDRLWSTMAAMSHEQARQSNLSAVVDALEKDEIPYVLLPGDHAFVLEAEPAEKRSRHVGGYRIAIEEVHKRRVLEALARSYPDDPVYVTPQVRGQDVAQERLATDILTEESLSSCTGLAVGSYFMSQDGTVRFGSATRCEIEFWKRENGVLLIPGRIHQVHTGKDLLEPLPDSELQPAWRVIGNRTYRSARAFTKPRAGSVDFPIDVVYTWVDGSDALWQQRRDAAAGGMAPSDYHLSALDPSRFRNHDELRYSIRSVVMHMPWVRHIYIVTDQQIPHWLNTRARRITVVDHKEIFKDGNTLPTFNSHAIESQLHHISGLSEQYLYMNDDVFVGRPVEPDLFFLGNGVAKFFPSPVTIPYGPATVQDEPHFAAGKNCRRLIEHTFGHVIRRPFLHTPHPQIRSVLDEIERQFPEDIERTASNRFRHFSDLAVATNLHHYFAFFTKRGVPGPIKWMYMDVSNPEHQGRVLRLLRSRDTDSFCLNDLSSESSSGDRSAAIHNILELYFPFACEFEADAKGPVVELCGEVPA